LFIFLLPNCNQMHITCKHTCSSTYHIYITSTSSHITIVHTSTQVHKST
jgi:hypothetical protein